MKKIILSLFAFGAILASHSQSTIYSEDFTGQNGKGVIGGSSSLAFDTSGVSWSINPDAAGLTATSDWFQVTNELFEGQDVDFEQVWISDTIDISSYVNISLSVDASEVGTMESLDYLDIEYSTDGGLSYSKIINFNGAGDASHTLIDDFTSATVTASGISGTSMVLKISMINNSGSEKTRFDNVLVTGSAAGSLIASISSQTNITCNSGTDGGITVVTQNGTANYSYNWSNGATSFNDPSSSNSITNLSAGTYTVTITDNGGNTATSSTTLTEPNPLVSSISTDFNVSCNGGSDGQLSVTTIGGTSQYTYLWSNGSTNNINASLTAGTYTVTTTDINGCITTQSATISEPAGILVLTDNIQGETCSNSNGEITAKASGGNGTLTFDWSNGTNYVASSSIVSQSFESNIGDTWNYIVSPAAYNASGDVWGDVTSLSTISPNDQSSFWGMSDLENSNGGGAFYHTITFDPISVSGISNAVVEFDYYTKGFDSSDELEYEVVMDNGTSWSTNGTALPKDNNAWITISTPIPNGTNHVRLRIQAKQNGSDYAGIDNVKIKVASDTSRSTISNLSAGNYDLTVTDESGCTSSTNFTVQNNSVGCNLPSNLRTIFIQDNSATLNWDTVAGAISYKVLWKVAGTPSWSNKIFKVGSSTREVLSSLTPNTKYDWAMMVRTASGWSGHTKFERFKTLASPCVDASNQATLSIHSDQAKLSWTIGSSTISNRIRYKIVGSNIWSTKSVSKGRDFVWITNLMADTTYEWQIKSVCSYGSSSGNKWTSINTFKTKVQVGSFQRIKFNSEEIANTNFTFFPNPTKGNITIETRSIENSSIKIYDQVGKLIISQTLTTFKENIDLSNLNSGIYIIKLKNGQEQITDRLIIQ